MKAIKREHVKKLESLLFWRREIRLLNNLYGSNPVECNYHKEKADQAIKYKLNELDTLGVPFSIQNAVLTYQDVHSDILDVMRENNIQVI